MIHHWAQRHPHLADYLCPSMQRIAGILPIGPVQTRPGIFRGLRGQAQTQSFAGSTWVLRSSGAASGDVMNLIIARAASGSFELATRATLDGHGTFRTPGSGPTYSVPGAPTMMLV